VSPAADSPAAALIAQLNLKPVPPELLRRALTHASFVNEAGAAAESNERLEFLGDALLGMVIGHVLYGRYPDAGEGELTRMRADLVRGSTLARVAQRIGLGELIFFGKGEEAVGGRARERNLAGAMEAIIGAVYIAHGYRAARALVVRVLGPELAQLHKEGARIDSKSSLQHLVQARWHEPPHYVTVRETSDGVARRFTVEVKAGGTTLGRGEGSSKREAQQQAARAAIAGLASAEGQGNAP
jgi:ribonuclease-3